ncbi:hypothetical protein ACP70R_006663 [Stipagrostis hirtigluma subsp. patula]
MDGNGGSQVVVLTELSRIIELVRQLEVHLGESPDLCRDLASQIISLTERSIGLVASSSLALSCSAMPSTVSDIGDVPFKVTRKRNMIQQRKHQVRVRSAGDGESPTDDGHSWRKYGQKGILGAKHPRSYYRCKHRHSQGCVATKQVQRTDDDPTLFDVTYHGRHTCVHQVVATSPAGQGAGAGAAAAQLPELIPDLESLSSSLTMSTEELPVPVEPHGWSAATPFGFFSTPASRGPPPAERGTIWAPVTPENWGMSAATTDSSHVVPFAPLKTTHEDGGCQAQSELQEVVSAPAVGSVPVLTVDIIADEVLDIDIWSFLD